ncbi:MAG TPA: hypothetical protein VN230_05040 [Burkholderiaceae bacterium]|nr:hypothetical protein [Burkholderiaceae bacterium]
MNTIYLHLPRLHTHRVIDITPVPWWRRTARAALALSVLLLAVPLLWLLGGLVALALLGGTAAMLCLMMVRTWWSSRATRKSTHIPSRPHSDPAP